MDHRHHDSHRSVCVDRNSAQQFALSRPLAQLNSALINGAHSNEDRLTIDYEFGGWFELPGGVQFNGGTEGNDKLAIIGTGTSAGSYSPNATVNGNGTLEVTEAASTNPISFTGLESLDVSSMTGFAFVTPNAVDAISLAPATAASGAAGFSVSGTSGGIGFESLTLSDTAQFELNLALADQTGLANDTLTLTGDLTAAVGLTDLILNVGQGTDTVDLGPNSLSVANAISLDSPGGTIVMAGGTISATSLVLNQGSLSGHGTIDATVSNLGNVEVIGTFDSVTLPPLPASLAWDVEYNTGDVTLHVIEAPSGATVVARHLFYNNSSFDGSDSAANAADDAAIAADKSALTQPGSSASFANYSSYIRGINGVMIDVAGLPATASLSVADFEFALGNDSTPASWQSAPEPAAIEVRQGAGVGGSDRVTITWPDDSIRGQWLEVRMLATPETGLAAADLFYFGNAPGETGNSGDTFVNATDFMGVRANPATFLSPAGLLNKYDFNRDGRVNGTDLAIVRASSTIISTALHGLTVPASLAKSATEKKVTLEEFNKLIDTPTLHFEGPTLKQSSLQTEPTSHDSYFSELAADSELSEALATDALLAEWTQALAPQSDPLDELFADEQATEELGEFDLNL